LEKDAVNLLKYMSANLLVANADKTQFMIANGCADGGPIRVGDADIRRAEEIELLGMRVDKTLGFSKHMEALTKSLQQRTGLLRRLSHHIPKKELRLVAEGICISKLRYGLAAYGIPRMSQDEPRRALMQDLQVRQNDIARVLTGSRRSDKVPVAVLLKNAGMTSVNLMVAETILMETWRLLNGDSADKTKMTSYNSVCPMTTRARMGGKLELGEPLNSFMYHGARLWNSAPQEVKVAKTKFAAKKAVKKSVEKFPL
jgi:hypothetical protein